MPSSCRGDLARRGQPVAVAHREVHHDDVGRRPREQLDRLVAARRLTHDVDLRRLGQHGLEPRAHDGVIVHQYDANRHPRPRSTCSVSGTVATTRVPRPGALSTEQRAVREPDPLAHGEESHPRSPLLGAPDVEAATIVHHLERRRGRGAAKPDLDAAGMRVAHRVAQRLLRHAIQHRRREPRNRCPVVGERLGVERFLLARLTRQPRQRRGEAEVVEHARMDRVREACAPPRARRPPCSRTVAMRASSAGDSFSRAATPSWSITAASICAVESCSSRATRARSSSCALITCAASRRTRARSLVRWSSSVLSVVPTRAMSRSARMLDATRASRSPAETRAAVRSRSLSGRSATYTSPRLTTRLSAERDAEDRDRVARQYALSLGHDDDERGEDDEQVGADQLSEQRNAQRVLGQGAQRRVAKRRRGSAVGSRFHRNS